MKTKLTLLLMLACAGALPAATGDIKGLTVVQAGGGAKAETIGAPSAGDIFAFSGVATDQLITYPSTTVGRALLGLTNPGAITFLKLNADNSVTARSASNFKSDLSLNNVENTALSTWAGSANLTTGAGGLFGTGAYATAADYLPKAGGTMTGNLLFTDNSLDIGASGATRPRTIYVGTSVFSPRYDVSASVNWRAGTGSPEGAITANIGSLYSQTDGTTDTAVWRKEAGTGNTGWIPMASGSGAAAAGTLTGDTLASGVIHSSLRDFGTLTNHLIFTDNTYDIGASGATRPRTLYLGTSIIVPTVTATTLTGAAGGVTLDASGFDGKLTTSDNTLQEVAQKLDDLSTGSAQTHALTFTVDGAGQPLVTGVGIPVKTPWGGTLSGYTMTCSPSGSVTVNIFRAADTAGLPVISIIDNAGGGGGSGTLPAISGGVEGKSTTFTSWGSTTLTAFDNLALNLTTVDGVVTKCTLVLYYQ